MDDTGFQDSYRFYTLARLLTVPRLLKIHTSVIVLFSSGKCASDCPPFTRFDNYLLLGSRVLVPFLSNSPSPKISPNARIIP